MRATILFGLFWSLAACGPDETKFIPEFADAYCDFVLACEDPALLTFDGVVTHEDCLAIYGPTVAAMGHGCKYKPGKASRCLRAMEQATCPADEDVPLDQALPSECYEVYIKCVVPQPADATTPPADTGT